MPHQPANTSNTTNNVVNGDRKFRWTELFFTMLMSAIVSSVTVAYTVGRLVSTIENSVDSVTKRVDGLEHMATAEQSRNNVQDTAVAVMSSRMVEVHDELEKLNAKLDKTYTLVLSGQRQVR